MLINLFAREECILINKAKAIAPWIVRVERAFTPGTFHEIAGAGAVHVFSRKTLQLARAFVDRFDIVDREIDVVGQRFRFYAGSVLSGHIDKGQNYRTTIDVMTRSRAEFDDRDRRAVCRKTPLPCRDCPLAE